MFKKRPEAESTNSPKDKTTGPQKPKSVTPTVPERKLPSAVEERAHTRIVVKYNTGFQNHLTIRGQGAGLSWNKGQPLENISVDEWVWETDVPFAFCEFKVLVNDEQYEEGENHSLILGQHVSYNPHF